MTRWLGTPPTRRRFVVIAAAAAGLPFAAVRAGAATAHLHRWSGIALGAAAEIVLHDPDAVRARRLIARCVAEIDRLEDVFSLYRPESAISRLNREASLAAPPLELVALLAEARSFSERTEGAFDVTVQPLWHLYTAHFARTGADPRGPGEAAHARAQALVDHRAVEVEPAELRFARPGMAITLNGIAQGYITDRVADAAAGRRHGKRPPRHRRSPGARPPSRRAPLARRPSPRGAAGDGRTHCHAHRPRRRHLGRYREPVRARAAATTTCSTPRPAGPRQRAGQVSVIAPRATMADALSTALAVSPPDRAASVCHPLPPRSRC